MEERLFSVSPNKRSSWTLAVPLTLIMLGEAMLFAGVIEACIIIHILNVLICVLVPTVFKVNPLIWQSFSLVSLLRILDYGIPRFTTTTLYWIALVYAILIITCIFIYDRSISSGCIAKIYNRLTKNFSNFFNWKPFFLPLALMMSLLLGYLQYNVLSMTVPNLRLIPDLSIENLAVLFLVMVFFVGLGEELIFRYFLQTELTNKYGPPIAIVLASLISAAMYSGYHSFIYIILTFIISAFFGSLFYRTRSLSLVVLIHGSMNFFIFSFFPFGWFTFF